MLATLGPRIREARERKGYKKAKDFARIMKVSPSSVSRWEQDESLPKFPELSRMMRLLEVPPADQFEWVAAWLAGVAGGDADQHPFLDADILQAARVAVSLLDLSTPAGGAAGGGLADHDGLSESDRDARVARLEQVLRVVAEKVGVRLDEHGNMLLPATLSLVGSVNIRPVRVTHLTVHRGRSVVSSEPHLAQRTHVGPPGVAGALGDVRPHVPFPEAA